VTAQAWTGWSAGLAAALAFAAADLFVAYQLGPLFGAVLIAAVAVSVLVAHRPIAGVYLALLAVPFEFFSVRVGGSAGLSPTEGLLALTALAVVARSVLREDEGEPIGLAHAAFGLFILVILVGVAYAQDSFAVLKIVFVWTVLLICSIHVASRDRATVERVLVCLAISGGIVGFVAMATSGNQQLAAGGAVATGRAQASFQQPNVLAFFLVLAFPVAVVLATRGTAWRRAVMAVAAGGVVGGLVLSLSRQGMIGAFVAVLVLLAWPRFRRQVFLLLALFLLILVLNLGTLTNQRDASIVGSRLSIATERLQTLTSGRTVEQDPRVKIWSAAPAMIADHPFLGVGAANYSKYAADYGVVEGTGVAYDHAHDVFLTITIEEGIVGLAVFLLFLIAVARAGRRALRHGGEDYPLALAAVAALVAELGMGIVDYPPRTNAIMGTILLLVGVVIAYDRLGAASPAPEPAEATSAGPPAGSTPLPVAAR
jgi:O-antigen ligase